MEYPDDWTDSSNLYHKTRLELSEENIHIGPMA